MKRRPKVIFVTDGDETACKTLQFVAEQIGGCCIWQSFGNPSQKSGEELIELILQTTADPVLVMFDDCGVREYGPGEEAMRTIATDERIDVIGAIAVASCTQSKEWAHVDVCIDRYGQLTEYSVDKEGLIDIELGRIYGDTVYILDELNIPFVVGVGDIGKMGGFDEIEKGAPITKLAVELILERGEYDDQKKVEKGRCDFT